jgi:rSAM/selenodomain-associated transferase 1
VIAKAPVARQVKTRMCPPLTPDEAAALAAALLADTVATARDSGADVWAVTAGAAAGFADVLPPELPRLAQRGDGLGARLTAAQADLFARGYDRVLLLGGDCPTVPAAHLRSALALLDGADAVLGPARDGGYTLVAAARPLAVLFAGVPMSTSHTLAATLAAARGAGLRTALLPPRHDLDTIADLVAALAAGELASAPATLAAVRGHVLALQRPVGG